MDMWKLYILVLSSCFVPGINMQKTALLIIDVQNCFIPGGTLPVAEGQEVIPIINHLRTSLLTSFDLVVVTQDWHCANHVSFASLYPGYAPLNNIDLIYNSEGMFKCNYRYI